MKKFLVLLLIAVSLFSCKKENKKESDLPATDSGYQFGKFVLNEGNFLLNNASLSFIGSDDVIKNDLFLQVNGFELGDVLQSFAVIGEQGFAVLNNSQKVEVMNMKDMQSVATITGFEYPRHILYVGADRAYISDGSTAGVLQIVNTNTNTIIGSIPVGNGPEKMVMKNGEVYVCNSGGWAVDNTISVVDVDTHTVLTTIVVGDRPVDCVADGYGNVWVLCRGSEQYDADWNLIGHTPAMMYRINTSSHTVTASQQIGVEGDHPSNIEISPEGDVIYYENNGVFAFNLNTGDLQGNEIILDPKGSLNVDPENGDIWCASVSDFSSPSTIFQYSPLGIMKKSFSAGIGSNAVVFNQ